MTHRPHTPTIEKRPVREHAADQWCVLVIHSADRTAWLRARLDGIGASEIAGVLGESPYDSPLSIYQKKVEPIEESDEPEFLFWGSQLEESIAMGYAKRTGRMVRMAGQLLRSTEHPWALATLDAETSEDGVYWWPLEIKNVNAMAVDQWEFGAPRHMFIQTQQQALVKGADRVTIAALIGGCQLVWEDFDRDLYQVHRIIAAGSRFWTDNVLALNPPEADGHKATSPALVALHPNDSGETVALERDFFDLDVARLSLVEEIKSSKKALKTLDNQFKAAIGDATFGSLPDGTAYSWKSQTKREHTVKESTTRVLRRHAVKDK